MKSTRGFTLIELLVVIAIIGILSSVVLASLNSARQKGRDTRRVSDIRQLQLALELAYDADAEYPDALSSLATDGYISVVPTDPGGSNYGYDNLTSASAACAVGTGVCASYVLGATLEDANNNALDSGWPTDAGTVSCDAATEYCVRP